MSEVNATGAAYAGDVRMPSQNAEVGMVSVGDVTLSPADAAEFVMMHRTQVMKKVGADRTEMAQQHLDRIKEARQYLTDLIDLKKFPDKAHSYHGRIPVTPDMIKFLKEQVGCSPGEYTQRVVYYGSAVGGLPDSVRDYYGFDDDGHGTGGDFKLEETPGTKWGATHNRFEIHGVTCLYKGDLDSVKEDLNNYIDQLNDSNNLFMTKFKSVVNSMNEALEGANSLADKSHDALKNLLSRW